MKTATIRKTPKGWRLSIASEPAPGQPYAPPEVTLVGFPTADAAESTLRGMRRHVRTLSRDSRSRVFTLRPATH